MAVASSAVLLSRSHADPPVTTRPVDVAGLKKQRVTQLARASALAEQLYSRGLGNFIDLLDVNRELIDASLTAAETHDERARVLGEAVSAAKKIEDLTTSRFRAGLTSDLDVARATAERLRVEILLAEEPAAK